RRRPRRPPPPAPPRPNLSVSATADAEADDLSRARETPAYLWRKDEKWHPVSYDGSTAAAAAAAASTPHPRRHRRRNPKKKPSNNPNPSSRMFSSDDDDGEEEDEEDEMLVSSTEDNSFEMTELRLRRAAMMEGAKSMESRTTSPGRRLSPCLGGEGESLAVVKQSEDPRSDFRRSMAEMVVEKGIYEAKELEQLLHCFLSLNSQHHHQAIIDAFTDVWVALFPATPFTRSPGPGNGSLWQSGNEGE
ncbi:transcription repressor OFP7-like, partial [Phalaenopsis equestris]|uniref:transcription repressor OFP7-like n=1 Tax=Phalaenopsis equestris TaxID=78828 RepID=UPI0009E559BA